MSSVSVIPSGTAEPAPLDKTLTVGTQSVQVTLESLPDEPVPAWHITAVCGGTTVEHRHTIGAVSGQIGSYDITSLQAEIDAVRLDVATKAAAIEAVRQLAAGLK